MNNNVIELTDIDVVEELKSLVQNLRATLETLLEDSSDEEQEKDLVSVSLEELSSVFTVLEWHKAAAYTQEAIDRVASLSSFGEGDAESFILRYCLILEQSLDSYEDEGFLVEADIVDDFNSDELKIDSEINVSLLKVLRTLYQRQLLLLIKSANKNQPLNALNALSRDISSTLPRLNARDWLLLSFYIQNLLKNENNLSVETHRLLAKLDVRLSHLVAKKDIDLNICDGLAEIIQSLPNGKDFIQNNILMQDVYSISPTVYKRFGAALKDELVKIHEQLERTYLDPAQRLRLEESLPFLEKLINVLKFMGLNRLSALTDDLLISFRNLIAAPVDTVTFNEIVSQFWVLESFLSDLWIRREQTVPLSYHETQNWAYISAKHSAVKLFVAQYRKIREQIANTKDVNNLKELQQKLFDTVKAETMLSIAHGLTRYFIDEFMAETLSQEELLEITLAVEYISNMNFENREIVDAVIHNAKTILHKHYSLVSQSSSASSKQNFDKDVLAAFAEDLENLEGELEQYIYQRPMDEQSYKALVRVAHTLRGNASVVNLVEVVQLATALENNMLANASPDDEKLKQYHQTFMSIIEQFKMFLQKFN